jgi:hypothetical protein
MAPALIACGWLIVIGMLSVCKVLLKVGVFVIEGAEFIPLDVGVAPFATEFNEVVT